MNRRFKIVLGLFLGAMLIVGGSVLAVYSRRSYGAGGWLTIENQSRVELRSFEVVVETCGATRTFRGGPVPAGRSSTISYNICGEGGQIVVASATDGRNFKSSENYVESGYKGTAVVSDTTIVMSVP